MFLIEGWDGETPDWRLVGSRTVLRHEDTSERERAESHLLISGDPDIFGELPRRGNKMSSRHLVCLARAYPLPSPDNEVPLMTKGRWCLHGPGSPRTQLRPGATEHRVSAVSHLHCSFTLLLINTPAHGFSFALFRIKGHRNEEKDPPKPWFRSNANKRPQDT